MNRPRTDPDWFERLFGLPEGTYEDVKTHFKLDGTELVCTSSGKSFGAGTFTHCTIQQLLNGAQAPAAPSASQTTAIQVLVVRL